MTPIEVMAKFLWDKFDYFLPIPPGQMAERIIKELEDKGFKIVRGEDANK